LGGWGGWFSFLRHEYALYFEMFSGTLFDRGMESELALWRVSDLEFVFLQVLIPSFYEGLVLFILYNSQKLLTITNYYYLRPHSANWASSPPSSPPDASLMLPTPHRQYTEHPRLSLDGVTRLF
jgi:hypothetical protein